MKQYARKNDLNMKEKYWSFGEHHGALVDAAKVVPPKVMMTPAAWEVVVSLAKELRDYDNNYRGARNWDFRYVLSQLHTACKACEGFEAYEECKQDQNLFDEEVREAYESRGEEGQ